MDEVLDREKVSQVFDRVFNNCPMIIGRSIRLMPPNADSVHSKGYQVHISPNNDESLQNCIEKIAKSNDLAIAVENDTLVIFNPLKTPHKSKSSNLKRRL